MSTTTPTTTSSTPTTTTTTRPFTNTPQPRPLTPHAHHPYYPSQPIPMRPQQQQQQTPPQSQGILYPLASSGRGFIPKTTLNRPQQQQQQQPDQTVTVANNNSNNNPTGYPPRPAYSSHRPPIGSPLHHHHLDSVNNNNNNHSPLHMIRAHPHPSPSPHHFLHHPHLGPTGGVGSGPIKGIPVTLHPKVAPSPSSVADSNGYKNLRDRSRDDNLFIVRDRKVRISDGVSLYALCRSWLKNGFPEESQPQYGDGIKSLPRPSPMPWPKKKEVYEAEEDEEEEDEKSVQHLSAQDLLQGHIKRAKRVRAGLREVRLKRIARYKSRLALLLPPLAEQFRN